jgi:hypothetical protein
MQLVLHFLLTMLVGAPQPGPLHWNGKMAPGTTLRVLNVRGSIHVTPASGDMASVDGETTLGREGRHPFVLTVDSDAQTVTICIYRKDVDHCSGGDLHGGQHYVDMDSDDDDGDHEGSRRADVTVQLPKGVRVQVVSGNGRVDVTDAGSDVTASSGNGAVTVRGAGGRVTASSGNGRVEVATAAGPVSASTGNGAIDVRMEKLTDASSDMHFTTGNGTITVTLPASYAGDLDASTGHGEVTSDFPLHVIGRLSPEHVHAEIGTGGGARLRMETGNGDLVLRKS